MTNNLNNETTYDEMCNKTLDWECFYTEFHTTLNVKLLKLLKYLFDKDLINEKSEIDDKLFILFANEKLKSLDFNIELHGCLLRLIDGVGLIVKKNNCDNIIVIYNESKKNYLDNNLIPSSIIDCCMCVDYIETLYDYDVLNNIEEYVSLKEEILHVKNILTQNIIKKLKLIKNDNESETINFSFGNVECNYILNEKIEIIYKTHKCEYILQMNINELNLIFMNCKCDDINLYEYEIVEILNQTYRILLLEYDRKCKNIDMYFDIPNENELTQDTINNFNQSSTNENIKYQYGYSNGKDKSFGKKFMDALKLFRNDVTVEEIVNIFG